MSRRAAAQAGAALAFLCAGSALAQQSPYDSTRAVLGIGAGLVRLESEGARPQVHFDLAVELRRWFELGAQLGLGYLESPDPVTVATHVRVETVARLRWYRPGTGWSPFARLGGGLAWWARSGPSGAGSRDEDPVWSAGGGLDCVPHRRILVRGEGLVLAHRYRHHAAASLGCMYVLP